MKISAMNIAPGQLVKEYGLITEVDRAGKEKFWQGKPNVHFICYHDAYYGACSAELRMDEEYTLVEGEEKEDWLSNATEEMLDRRKNIEEDLEFVRRTIIEDDKNGTND